MSWLPNKYIIAPSILSADFARLGEEVTNVLAAGADVIHFDVMDNHYVPNLTIGPMVCKALRDHGVTAPIDVHLMVSPVDSLITEFIKAGASHITFHPEATSHIDRSLQLIKDGGCKAGLVFNPATPLDSAKYVLDKLDIILLMSVNPGFGGQKFIPKMLDKAREARKLIDDAGIDCRLMMDGGVKIDNIRDCAEAGVDMFVAGSAIFKNPRTVESYTETIQGMRAELEKAERNDNSGISSEPKSKPVARKLTSKRSISATASSTPNIEILPNEATLKKAKVETRSKYLCTVGRLDDDSSPINKMRLDTTCRHLPEPCPRKSGEGHCCMLCRWATGKKISAQLLRCTDCNVVICSFCYGSFHTVPHLDEEFKLMHERTVLERQASKGAKDKKSENALVEMV